MAAGSTYTPIATYTSSGNATSYTFTSIPQTYTDLILVVNGRTDDATTLAVQVGNGLADTGSNYSFTYLVGNGSAASSGRGSNQTYGLGGDTATTQSNGITQFMNYSNTTTFKTMVSRGASADLNTYAAVNLWRSTSAINTIKIGLASPRYFINGATLTLYGIAAA
jgi:hypothetical protein